MSSTSAVEVIDFSKLPSRLNAQDIMSSNSWIKSRKWKAITSREQSNYGHQSATDVVSSTNLSRNLTFYVSDTELYMDGMNMYVHCDFRAVATDSANNVLDSYLDVGGIQSCIEQVHVELANRTLENINEYDKLNSAISMMSDSAWEVDYNKMSEADSVADFDQYDPRGDGGALRDVKFATANATISTAGVVVLGNAVGEGLAEDELEIGDTVYITSGANASDKDAVGEVVAIADQLTFTINPRPTVASVATDITRIRVMKQNSAPSTRARVMNQAVDAVRLTFKLRLESLRQMKYFPLRFVKAPLKITIRFKEAPLCIVLKNSGDVAINNKIGYIISEPELVVPMIEAHDSAVKIHQKIVDNQGLVFPYRTYEHHQREFVRASPIVNLTFQTNLASVRNAMFVITDTTLANSNTNASQAHASNSTFYKNFLKSVRYQIGALRFPDYGDLDTDELFSAEAFIQTVRALNGDQMMLKERDFNMRVSANEYQSLDSEKFVCALPFSKDDSPWTGSNLSLNYLELKLVLAGTPSNLVNNGLLHVWLCHDAIVRIHKDGVSVFN